MTVVLQDGDASARELIERVLRDGEPIAEEYPLVFDSAFDGRVVALGENGEAHSACGILVREFVVPSTRVRGGLIGSVTTDPEWRAQGLATRVLIEAEAALQREGCAFALLWAEDPKFYLERGYCPVGAEQDFLLESKLAQLLPEPDGVREMGADDHAAIHTLYEAHPVRIARSAEETAALLRCPNMRTLVLERDGSVVAYACMGRGRDLRDAIHEWSGATEDVLALVRAHLERRFPEDGEDDDGFLFLMAPPTSVELTRRLTHLGVETRRGILGLGKVLDREAVADVFQKSLAPDSQVELVETAEGTRFRVQRGDREGYLDDDAALALLVPADELRESVQKFLGDFGVSGKLLPIDPFVWGLDSI